jgi:hypothetical protein|uniref:Uncharacterized protein n=1 Tax=Oryza nivara TaxID=4536 RepID=A0A0E0H033_ORYNI
MTKSFRLSGRAERWFWESVPSPSPPLFADGLDPMFVTTYVVHLDSCTVFMLEAGAACDEERGGCRRQ